MKRKNFKSLKLNKKIISNFYQSKIKGGNTTTRESVFICGPRPSIDICDSDYCPPSKGEAITLCMCNL